MPRFLLATVACLTLACGVPLWTPAPERPFPVPASTAAIRSITLLHNGCFGACGVYAYRLQRDGTARYVGSAFVPVIGGYVATVDSSAYERLASLLIHRHFFEMPTGGYAFDLSSTTLIVGVGDTEKVAIISGGRSPDGLDQLAQAVEDVAAKLAWHPDLRAPSN